MRLQPAAIGALTNASLHEVYLVEADSLRFLYVGAGALRNLGYGREAVVRMACPEVQPELPADAFHRLVQPLLDGTRRRLSVRTTHRRADGSLYPVDLHVLLLEGPHGRRLLLLLAVLAEVAERTRTEDALYELAYRDALTGLPNRALLRVRLERALAQARGEARRRDVALLALSVDRFAGIIDSLGRRAGDAVLRTVAGRLGRVLDAGDTLARLDGAEFAVLPGGPAGPPDMLRLAQRLRESVAGPAEIEGREVVPTVSVGIARSDPEDGGPDDLMTRAETALHGARAAGGDTARFFTEDMNARALDRLTLEAGLRRAEERNELVLHYQPQVDIGTGRLIGFEALLRWRHPGLGLVPPDRFIALAEHVGLIHSIGRWALRTACAQAKAWAGVAAPPIRMAVNLSARQLVERDIVKTVAESLRDTGLDPRCLELELTESTIAQGDGEAAETLRALKALGVRLSIDDFGTGYSSLKYLALFPVDTVKIDRSFIQALPASHEAAAITCTILGLARSLRLTVVAEGVETPPQLECLRRLGREAGHAAQGYLCGRPEPAATIARLLGTAGAAALPSCAAARS